MALKRREIKWEKKEIKAGFTLFNFDIIDLSIFKTNQME